MTTKQWTIIKGKLVCKITSSWLWKGRNLTVFSHRESRGVRGVGKKNIFVPERSSSSLPRQGSRQRYYTLVYHQQHCSSAEIALWFSILWENTEVLSALFFISTNLKYLLCCPSIGWSACWPCERFAVTAQSKVGAVISWCVIAQKSTTLHSNCPVKSHSFSHDDYTEWIKHAGICNSWK